MDTDLDIDKLTTHKIISGYLRTIVVESAKIGIPYDIICAIGIFFDLYLGWQFDPNNTKQTITIKENGYVAELNNDGGWNDSFLYNSITNQCFFHHNIQSKSNPFKIKFKFVKNVSIIHIGICSKYSNHTTLKAPNCEGCAVMYFGAPKQLVLKTGKIHTTNRTIAPKEGVKNKVGNVCEMEFVAIENKWMVKWHCDIFKQPATAYIQTTNPIKMFCSFSSFGNVALKII
eukprot:170908_1